MPLPAALCQALNLPADADEDTAVKRVKSLSLALDVATNRANQPDIEKFIPRADYDAALNRASAAEAKIAEIEKAALNQQIETALNTALQAGQICPATVEFYRGVCQKDGGLEAFNQFLKSAPPVLGVKPDLDSKKPQATALNRAAFEALSPVARAEALKAGTRITD